jgi:alkaline phosphatase D
MKGWVLFFVLWGAMGGCASIESSSSSEQTGLELGCATGDVTPTEATIWIKGSGSQSLAVQYGLQRTPEHMVETDRVSPMADTDFTVKINLTELTPKTRYIYRAVVEGNQAGPLCQFVTAPLPEDSATVTFVIGGDTRHSFQPFSILETMRQVNPDFFVFLGDTIYADKEAPAQKLSDYWDKYVENRDGFAQRLLAETSVYVMWDDHEVDSDFISTNHLMPVGRQAFFDYWPIRRQAQEPTRLYRAFRWGKAVELFLLDTRQYRSPSTKTMLGDAQKRWLLEKLAASSARFKFIISSVPFSDPRVDKWGEYPEERDEILGFLAKHGITGVLFLAGDVHHAAVSRLPGFMDRKEFIFGPLAAPMNYKISGREPRFEYFNEDARNFGKITVQPDELKPLVQVEWFDERNTLLHRVILEGDRYDFFLSR